jgi:purine-cytosine permease-like protein
VRHGTWQSGGAGISSWQLYSAGLAFVIALSGLGWTGCANDYTRYCAVDLSRRQLGWSVFLATSLSRCR